LGNLYHQGFWEEHGLYGKTFTDSHLRGKVEQKAAETDSINASFRELHEKYERRQKEIRRLLEETGVLTQKAVVFLKKANRLTRYLTARQRHETGIFYYPSFFDSRLKGNSLLPVSNKILDHDEVVPELAEHGRLREPEPEELRMLYLIDILKKNLLTLDLLEMRLRELVLSIDKAMKAFRHEYAFVRRRVYPYSFFSVFCKHLRRFRGFSYFSARDLKELAVLGELTGHVLKLADSPIL
jgi:hypothetical protein